MKNSMFLLEVYDRDYQLFKRRISDSLSALEDWIDENAQKWVWLPVQTEHDGYGSGKIFLVDNPDGFVYTYTITNIAVV